MDLHILPKYCASSGLGSRSKPHCLLCHFKKQISYTAFLCTHFFWQNISSIFKNYSQGGKNKKFDFQLPGFFLISQVVCRNHFQNGGGNNFSRKYTPLYISRSASQNSRLSKERTRAGWILIGAIMSLGSSVVKGLLPRYQCCTGLPAKDEIVETT